MPLITDLINELSITSEESALKEILKNYVFDKLEIEGDIIVKKITKYTYLLETHNCCFFISSVFNPAIDESTETKKIRTLILMKRYKNIYFDYQIFWWDTIQ
ncbi:hypothetical protein EDEG_03694 [Edhazardia aedis USNM 41457]|uniref:Uncharacterized protein n=1 Tax=Edhazardia aedis (strain USNM 41457) TaxID=1003232 RepID=J9DKB1_EDHAE|nr:hypothetical protein EDEG_03694 [Edhazardia aedis USNM 41457]|eukprot:EJW01817.1 hypothetical protein EDEG_03694 [Edhazardia aedis USNM 41457]